MNENNNEDVLGDEIEGAAVSGSEKGQGESSEEKMSTTAGLLMFCGFIGGVLTLVSLLGSAISSFTGSRYKLEGIVMNWENTLMMFCIAAVLFGSGWFLDLSGFKRFRRKHKWIWLVLFMGVGCFFYGIYFAVEMHGYGGLTTWNAAVGNLSGVTSSVKGKNLPPKELGRILSYATSYDQHKIVEMLFQNGADPNAVFQMKRRENAEQYTIFHEACRFGDLKMIKLFLKNGAVINKKSKDKMTAVSILLDGHLTEKDFQKVKFLISKGAKLGRLTKSVKKNIVKYEELRELLH